MTDGLCLHEYSSIPSIFTQADPLTFSIPLVTNQVSVDYLASDGAIYKQEVIVIIAYQLFQYFPLTLVHEIGINWFVSIFLDWFIN